MPLRVALRDRRRTISNRLICMRNTMLGLLATPIAAAKGVLPEPASQDAKSKPGDVTANLPLRQFQPFRRLAGLESTLGYRLNDLQPIHFTHRHGDRPSRVHRQRSQGCRRSTYRPKHDIFI